MSKYRRLRQRRRGVTAVEFAIVAPVIFGLFIGAVEITRLNFIRNAAANAAYEGARKAVTPGSSASDASDEALRLLNILRVGRGSTVDVDMGASTVTVQVNIPVNQNSWGLTRFSSGMDIEQSCTLSRESFSN